MKMLTEIPFEDLKIRSSNDFYDHPLSGLCYHNGKVQWFEWGYQEDTVKVYELSTLLRLLLLWQNFLFCLMVGAHHNYRKNGSKVQKNFKAKYIFGLDLCALYYTNGFVKAIKMNWLSKNMMGK